MNVAVIVETRELRNMSDIIDRHMRYLPGWEVDQVSDIPMKSPYDYNDLMTSLSFWLKYVDYDRVLIFQHDSGLLRYGIDDFLEYDYVGAPWKESAPWAHPERLGGNGGLSLRNPRKMLELIDIKDYEYRYGNEDVFYVRFGYMVDMNIAPYEVCKKFSCESMFQLGTLGYHQIESHLTLEEIAQIKNSKEVA